MKARKIAPSDREALLTSFKPLFGDWDYLPLVIDDWFSPSSEFLTWVVYDEPSDSLLVAMAQIEEIEPGDWYLRGLRSNPLAKPAQVASAILALKRAIGSELKPRRVDAIRYGTLPDNHQSLRLARLFGFQEHFRQGHAWHSLREGSDTVEKADIESPGNPEGLLDYFNHSLKPVYGYFFTWWDTRRLSVEYLTEAQRQGCLFKASVNRRMVGAVLLWHIPWQKFLVFSVLEGRDDALKALFGAGVRTAHSFGCKAIGLVHPSLNELHRRQALFGLEPSGQDTVQFINQKTGR
jgi:hypothetical protein